MKNMRKLFALALAVMLVMSLAGTAFAADTVTGSITIKNATVGQTYTIYQILDLESYDADAGTYAYKATTEWANFINRVDDTDTESVNEAIKDVYVKVDNQGYVTWVSGANAAKFAEAAQAYAKASSITPSKDAVTATSAEVQFEGLDLGYYLVDTTLGTLCALNTTNPSVEMKEKNGVPSITKEVQEDSDSSWGETNDADINQVVDFKATVTVKDGAENYVMYDNMSAGLTWNGTVEVTVNGTTVDASKYTVTKDVTVGDVTYDFAVAFKNEYIETLTAGTQIVVTYSATLNENAVVGLPGNPNEVILKYGDETKPSWTTKVETTTYTWDAKIIKYAEKTTTGEGGTETTEDMMLSGATFKLSTDESGQNVLKFHSLGDNKYEYCAKADCTKQHVTEITTDTTGAFTIEGLDSGDYYLTETKAPDGYNQLAGAVKFTVTAATAGEDGNLTYSTVESKVENKAGTELPETGGMGTTLFYIVGGFLVMAAAVLLVTKKRMGYAE